MIEMALSLLSGSHEPPMEGPSVSVVITVRNDARVIACVDAVLSQSAEFDFDVAVVSNRSDPSFEGMIRRRYAQDERVQLVTSGGNLSEAWNAGARAARGPILLRIDADAVPEPGWLTGLARPLLDGRADWAAGWVGGLHPDSTLVGRYFQHRTEAYLRRLRRDSNLRDAVPSWNVGYTRAALESAGWYDPWQASSVDWDLHKRLRQAGARGVFVPEARARHAHPQTWREFVRKEAWYRTGQYQMALKYGFREMVPAFLLPGAYALLLILLVASIGWTPLSWAAGLLLLTLLVRHWTEAYREGDPLWPYRALFRPVEGLAGLIGLLRGLIRYGIRMPGRPGRQIPRGPE